MELIKGNLWRVTMDELKARGRQTDRETFRFHCPLCGDKPNHHNRVDGSFNQLLQVGQCFSCGASFVVGHPGSGATWEQRPAPAVRTAPAARPAQPPVALQIPGLALTDFPTSLTDYLKGRGLRAEVVQALGVGWRTMFNSNNQETAFLAFRFLDNGELANVQYKSPDKQFRMESGGRMLPWNIDALRSAREGEPVYITEGMMDACVLAQCGYGAVVSLPNGCGTRMSCFEPYLDLFRGHPIVYAGDTDEKGLQKRSEVARYFQSADVSVVEWALPQPPGQPAPESGQPQPRPPKDANDVLMAGGEEAVRACIEAAQPLPMEGVETVDTQMGQLRELTLHGMPQFPGIALYGFTHLVRFEPGRLMVVSGYPGAGKSSFADFLVMSLAVQQGWRAAIYSPEKYPQSLHYYELGQMLMGREMQAAHFTPQELEQGLEFLRQHIYHISEERTQIEDILATATQLRRRRGIRVLLLDPFNYIDLPVLSGANDTQKISHVLKQIVEFAHRERVLVILVAHPKKPSADVKHGEPQLPSLYDIAGSADFYNKCDYGLILQRDTVRQRTFVHVLKVRSRHLGQLGCRAFCYDGTSGRFYGTTDDGHYTPLQPDRRNWSALARSN